MNKLFWGSSKGTITVFASLILIPVVFFTGFFADLIRIKSYTNMAVMAADSYGEAYLTEYDNLLKELYGLFAITQESDKLAEAEYYKDAILWDFDPSGEKVTGQNKLIAILTNSKYVPDGSYLPVKGVNASLECNVIDYANLNNPDVLATQINDFMKLRIAQVLLEDEDNLLETLERTKELEDDCKIINKKMTYDEKAQDLLEAVKDYYEEAKRFQTEFTPAVYGLWQDYDDAESKLREIAEEEVEKEEELAKEKEEASESEEDDETDSSAEDIDIVAMRQEIAESLNKEKDDYSKSVDDFYEVRGEYVLFLANMKKHKEKVEDRFKEFAQAKQALVNTLNSAESPDKDLKEGIEKDMENYDKLLHSQSGRVDCYIELVDFLYEHLEPLNNIYDESFKGIDEHLKPFIDGFLAGEDPNYDLITGEMFSKDDWKEYKDASNDVWELYAELVSTFEKEGDANKAERKKNKANNMRKKSEKVLDENEDMDEITKRNISSSFNFGDASENDDVSGENRIHQMVANTTGYFGSGNNTTDVLMTKFFVVAYDTGMFTCRTTNVGNNGEVEQSITRVDKTDKVNYLYRAEMEYILCGHNKTQKNLDSTRNRILGFRGVMNYMASYQIKEINNPIRAIESAAPPLIGVAVGQALRFAFAGIETYADWDLLKKGEKVLVIKSHLEDLSAKADIDSLLYEDDEGEDYELKSSTSNSSSGFKLNYKQYVQVMLLFFIQRNNVLKRTSNVITLNMNNVKYQLASGQELDNIDKFRMQDANTAVEAYCSVRSGFVVMPKGFAQKVVPGLYGEIVSLEDNEYRFKVTRSY